ncbi:MAG: hypothetical protein E6J76_09535 [Deltaproteobacteria bacterium]|nr:MAG: hypothetical protein E6J76_09535 [Deltaproteobacteria bacterium]
MSARGATVLLLCSLGVAPATEARQSSLYSGRGPRPGPDILYAAATVAPQLENVGIWSAAPILVSGASAYRGGEFLYQDFLYDDHGAAEIPDPTDPRSGGDLFSKPNGTYTYPTDAEYANDAADLVELRVKPLPDATAFRVTLVPHRSPCWDQHGGGPCGRRHGASGRRPGSPRRGRHRPAADRGARAARRLGSDRPGGSPGRWRGPVGQGERPLPAAPGRGGCDPPRRRGDGGQPGRFLQRRLPLRRADARSRRPGGLRHRPGLVARQGPGCGARHERLERAPRRRRLREARRRSQRRHARPARRRAADRPH